MRIFVRENRNNYVRPPGRRSGTPSFMQLQNCLVNGKAQSFRAFRVFFCPTSGLFARSKQTGRVFQVGEIHSKITAVVYVRLMWHCRRKEKKIRPFRNTINIKKSIRAVESCKIVSTNNLSILELFTEQK